MEIQKYVDSKILMLNDNHVMSKKKKISITKSNIFSLWITASILLNACIDTNYIMLCGTLIINLMFVSLLCQREIKKHKKVLFYLLGMSFIYALVYKTIIILRFSIYIIDMYCYTIISLSILKRNEGNVILLLEKLGMFSTIISISEIILKTNIYLNFLGVDYSALTSGSGYRVCGIAIHPIINASFSLVIFFVSILAYKKNKNNRDLIVAFFQLLVICFTKSRSAYLALTGILCITMLKFFTLKIRSVSKKTLTTVIALLTILILSALLIPNVQKMFIENFIERFMELSTTGSGSYLQRMGSVDYITYYLGDNLWNIKTWLGHGYGNLISFLYTNKIYFVRNNFYVIDNQYISAIYDIGIFNTLILGVAIARMIRTNRECDLIIKYCAIAILILIYFFEFIDKSLDLVMFGMVIALLAKGRDSLKIKENN